MTKVAILIDGGFFLKRLPSVRKDIDASNPAAVAKAIGQLTYRHLEHLNGTVAASSPWALLYRCFYYDARPYTKKGHRPVSGKAIDYAKTPEAQFRLALFDKLRKQPNVVVRLGEVIRERSWVLKEDAQAALLKGERTVDKLTDDDFLPAFRQKAVDMRIGVDMASITLKKQADTIVLVTGDADFVPAAKLARREGVRVVLDPLWRSVAPELFEHIDGLRSGFAKPQDQAPIEGAPGGLQQEAAVGPKGA
jgi:uncharacterized LabA/DUF88 family protein